MEKPFDDAVTQRRMDVRLPSNCRATRGNALDASEPIAANAVELRSRQAPRAVTHLDLSAKGSSRMTRATAVLSPGVPVTLAPAGHISFEIESGQRVRLTQPEGEQVADFISFNRDDVRELLSMHSSRAVNLNWRLTAPHVLYSNRSQAMWRIEEDLTGENYCGGGYCSEHLNAARYGAVGNGAPNCQSNLEAAVRGYGMDRWSFNVDACFNVFMTVAYEANGTWEIRPPKGKPGDYMTMLALMPQIVAISNCPVLFNACNNFRLKPLTLEILKAPD
jgi:uncharacterized protein YcgI (DUF1989 family)